MCCAACIVSATVTQRSAKSFPTHTGELWWPASPSISAGFAPPCGLHTHLNICNHSVLCPLSGDVNVKLLPVLTRTAKGASCSRSSQTQHGGGHSATLGSGSYAVFHTLKL
jgi:hypothetical protein